jgi:hypothetical protein
MSTVSRVIVQGFLLAFLVLLTLQAARASGSDQLTVTWGDLNCEAGPNPVDALGVLRYDAGQSVVTNTCPDLGSLVNVPTVGTTNWAWGDIDCSGAVDPIDGLKLLRYDAGLTVTKADPACPDVGTIVEIGLVQTLEDLLPDDVDGEPLNVQAFAGGQLLATDEEWQNFADSLAIAPSAIELAIAHPGPQSNTRFTMAAIRATGVDWAIKVADLFAAAQGGPSLAAEQITVSGKQVVRMSAGDSNDVYYFASGDILFMIVTDDEGLASEALTALPAAQTIPDIAGPQGEYVPGTGPLLLTGIQLPVQPVCVAEPPGRQHLSAMVLDATLLMPIPAIVTPVSVLSGELTPITGGGPLAHFYYEATTFMNEQVQLQAIAPTGGSGVLLQSFPVQHCLNGTWQDGSRVLTISHNGSSVTANITSGTLSCGEAGVAFSGTLDPLSDTFTGNDLKVCNFEDCVEAGHLPATEGRPYTARISDGQSVEIEWIERFFDLVYDDENNLVGCPEVSTSTSFDSISRITFGPGVP